MLNPSPAPQDPASPAADAAPDPSVLRAERRLRLLEELAEIGMELARALKPGVPADEGKGRDPADVFGPLSRAIRLTLALEARTDQELRDLKAGIVRTLEGERTRTAERGRVAAEGAAAYEHKVSTLVVEAAEAEIEDVDALDTFFEALEQHLDEDEAYIACADRPLRETVERLCRDLTLDPDWSRWDGEGWIHDGPPVRPRCSAFHQPSRTPIRDEPTPRPQPPIHDLQ